MDEQLNPGELEEVIRSKEAHSRAIVLESVSIIHRFSTSFVNVIPCKLPFLSYFRLGIFLMLRLSLSTMYCLSVNLTQLPRCVVPFCVVLCICSYHVLSPPPNLYWGQNHYLNTIFSRFGTVSSWVILGTLPVMTFTIVSNSDIILFILFLLNILIVGLKSFVITKLVTIYAMLL